jgi:hypothetical protein
MFISALGSPANTSYSFHRIERQDSEADHSRPPSAKEKNVWMLTSTALTGPNLLQAGFILRNPLFIILSMVM